MFKILISVTVVMVTSLTFMLLVIRSISQKVSNKLAQHVADELSAFDVLIDEKEKKLDELKNEIDVKQQKISQIRIPEKIHITDNGNLSSKTLLISDKNYIGKEFLSNYEILRKSFDFNIKDVIGEVENEINNNEFSKSEKALENIYDSLTIDTVFSLSVLPYETQYEIITESFGENEKKYLNDYMKSHHEFDIAKFYSYIKNQYYRIDSKIYVKTNKKYENVSHDDNIVMSENSNICDGMQIYYRNKLYDYSIQKTEICR